MCMRVHRQAARTPFANFTSCYKIQAFKEKIKDVVTVKLMYSSRIRFMANKKNCRAITDEVLVKLPHLCPDIKIGLVFNF